MTYLVHAPNSDGVRYHYFVSNPTSGHLLSLTCSLLRRCEKREIFTALSSSSNIEQVAMIDGVYRVGWKSRGSEGFQSTGIYVLLIKRLNRQNSSNNCSVKVKAVALNCCVILLSNIIRVEL